ncbi:MAG: hypothetical protein AUI11_10025 [Acidobacteria bacterium 13_2_20CM_2_66_4]|nr:MAG: hypothetical protein AUI11_10025 [Acidobacteria bacterium 13_2_20CM_2_66_4]
MRFGSALETIARAWISSPLVRTTPVAPPPATATWATSADVLIWTPAARAAAASASTSAAAPPFANQPVAIGSASVAPSSSSTAALPADHGPRNDPRMPPAARAARSGSLSNHSPARSATAIGIQRSRRYASALPNARNLRPALSASNRSARDGSSTDGGAADDSARSTPLMRAKLARNFGYWSASLDENARML